MSWQDEVSEEIDIAKELSELKELEKEREVVTSKLEKYVAEIVKATGEQD